MTRIRPFEIAVTDDDLVDLHGRLSNTRFPSDMANDDWQYGFPTDYLVELVDHWKHVYEWRTAEAELNSVPNFIAEFDDAPIHFVHVRGKGSAPIPLIATHGWPWVHWDMHKLIGPLTDPAAHGLDDSICFDLVIPSLPGFGFSTPLRCSGINFWRTADLWVDLMNELGYDRFGAYGCDWGAFVTAQLGHKYADHVIGVHGVSPLSLFNVDRPWAEVVATELPEDPEQRRRALEWERVRATHLAINTIEPQTMAVGLHDSPAALAAWLIERRRAWSDCGGDVERRWSKDELITIAMIYWLNAAAGTSMRFYREAVANRWRPAHDRRPVIEVPVGVSLFRPDLPPAPRRHPALALMADLDVVSHNVHDEGGHFAPAEVPHLVVSDLRETFTTIRRRHGEPGSTG